MIKPKVSICIPAYQQVGYLKRTIDSVFQQDFNDFELIIADDSVDDSVKEMLDAYENKAKISYHKNKIKLGSPENWNEVVKHAKGEYIKILHHDDWFSEKDSLRTFVQMLDKNSQVDMAFSAAKVYHENTDTYTQFIPGEVKINSIRNHPHHLFFGNLIGPPSSIIYRRSVDLKFDSHLKWLVDIDFYISLLLRNPQFTFTNRTLITSTTDAKHQVTNECIDNKEVELFEYTYLYNKLQVSYLDRWKYYKFFRRLTRKYNVKKADEIKLCGYNGNIPGTIKMAIFSNKLIK